MRILFTVLILLWTLTISMAQENFAPVKYNLEFQKKEVSKRPNQLERRAPGDIIWSEDFDGADWAATSNNGVAVPANAPEGFELGDLSGNGYYFRWDDVGPRGIFTSPNNECQVPYSAMNSTTGNNGYLMIEPDYYNSSSDCSEYYTNGMDSYIEYNAGIDFSEYPGVHITFEQMNRFCCGYSATADAWFMISTDNGTTWQKYSVSISEINDAIGNGETAYIAEFDVSQDVVGQSNVWFRFHLMGLTHYYWLVDDVAFVVPEANNLKLNDYWNDYVTFRDGSNGLPFADAGDFSEGYYEYPWFTIQHFRGFHAAYSNFGYNTQNEVVHNVEVIKNGQLYKSFISEPVTEVLPGVSDTTMFAQTWLPTTQGDYVIKHYLESNVDNDTNLDDTLSRDFKIGDSHISTVDFDKVNENMSPDNWSSFDENGDGLGFVFNLPDPSLHGDDYSDYYRLNGASFYLSLNNGPELELFYNEEAKVVASVHKYDSISEDFTEIISSAEYTLTLADTGAVIYIPFALDGTSEYVFQGGKFLVALNMYGTWYDSFDRLQSWNIKGCSDNIQKISSESYVSVNASVIVADDITFINAAPAMALDIWYSGEVQTGITFQVEDEDGMNVSDATINIEGYGSQTTTYYGLASFSNIPEGSSINFSISKSGYETLYDTIDEVVYGSTYYAELIKESYEISFYVNDGTNPLVNAAISINGFADQYTDNQGLATFISNQDQYYDYYYNVDFEDYSTVSGYFTDLAADTLINVTIDTSTYNATFIVTDGVNPISNVEISLHNEGIQYTDDEGIAIFRSIIPTPYNVPYTANAEGYFSNPGHINIDDQDIVEEIILVADTINFDVTFLVNDGNLPIEGAQITIGWNETIITNSAGVAVYEDVLPGSSFSYSVFALGYYQESGYISDIQVDIMETVSLEANPTTYQVTFYVNDDNNPIEGAYVSLDNYGILETNAYGEVTFFDVSPELDILYSVSADGFDIHRDYISVLNESVYMNIDMGSVGISDYGLIVNMFPNPSNGIFNIVLEGKYSFEVLDLSGKVMYESNGVGHEVIDLRNDQSGVYFVKIKQQNQTITKRLIIK